jgi:bifunctional NMN adenylyltransferase/nudix hydrolase
MKPDICVFAGRFRPFHAGHHFVVKAALDAGQYVFVIVGSINEPINFRNPFTFGEVREMIRASLSPEEADRVFILGIEDQDTDIKWVTAVQAVVAKQISQLHLGNNPAISLIGYSKDASSYYLKLFPHWGAIEVKDGNPDIDATAIRGSLYSADKPALELQHLHENDKFVPHGTYWFLREWVHSSEFERLRAEYFFMTEYLSQFSQEPYPRFFTAADACVIQAGHVLLVRRGQMPGEGLWALPGGHVGMHESFKDAAIRELIEETGIDAQPATLRLLTRGEKLLDNPWRSTRMRTVSVAYGIYLEGTSLPAVEGKDDANCARWWPIDEVTREMLFEDHFNVIAHFANQFRDL